MSTILSRAFAQLLLIAMFASTTALYAQDARPAARKAEWAKPVDASANLYTITPSLYRSAQLAAKDVALVKSLGIQTVVSLRKFHNDEALFVGTGVQLKRVRINTWSVGDKHVIAALKAIKDAEKDGPVLLHCLHGADRTGLVSAMYRMIYQGWSKDDALQELTQGGYGYHSMWKNIPTYIKKVDIEKIRLAVEKT